MSDLLEQLQGEIDRERLMETVRTMTERFPYRLAGSACCADAAGYVTRRMEELGMDCQCQEFYTYNSAPLASSVQIMEPVQKRLDSLPCGHIRSTAAEGEDFELVYVGDGARESYRGKDVRGKMVLVEVSYAPPVPEKACIAVEMGAAGIMCMNWGNDEEVICHRALKSVWGNPTEQSFPQIPDLVGVGVTRLAGLELRELCRKGRVVVHVKALADRTWSKVQQPHGVIRGNGRSDEFLLLASHLDAWQPGVTCNATGNATALELCRVLSAHREELDRDVHVVFWNGHEIAEAAGSTWFVDHHWELLNQKCIAYIHADSTGVSQTEVLEIKISGELAGFARQSAADWPDEKLRMMSLKKIGDMSTMGIGIPALCQRIAFSRQAMEAAHGATLGWWNHTCRDSLDKCSPDTLYQDTVIHAKLICGLLNTPILPYAFSEKLSGIACTVDRLAGDCQAHLDLSDLQQAIRTTRELVQAAEDRRDSLTAEQIPVFNDFVKAVSRHLTNIFQTYAEKYGQDRYGFYKLAADIPLLADLERLGELDPSGLEYGLVETQLVRNKNRILDGLKNICDLARLTILVLAQKEAGQ